MCSWDAAYLAGCVAVCRKGPAKSTSPDAMFVGLVGQPLIHEDHRATRAEVPTPARPCVPTPVGAAIVADPA